MNAFTAKEHTAFYARLPAHHARPRPRPARRRRRPRRRFRARRGRRRAPGDPRGDRPDRGRARRRACTRSLTRRCSPATRSGARCSARVDTIEAMRRDDIAGFFARALPAGQPRRGGRRRPRPRRRWSTPWPSAFAALDAGGTPVRAAPAGRRRRSRLGRRHGPPSRRTSPSAGGRSTATTTPTATRSPSLNHVLGGGMSSRLFQEIREERGLAYSVYSYTSLYADAGCLVAYAGTSPDAPGRGPRPDGVDHRRGGGQRHHRPRARGGQGLPPRRSGARPRGLGQPHVAPGRQHPRARLGHAPRRLPRAIDAVTTDAVARVAAAVLATPPSVATIAPRSGRRRG